MSKKENYTIVLGEDAAAERPAKLREKQERLNELVVHELDDAIKGGLKTLIPWVKKYTKDADDVSVDFKRDIVFEKLFAAGYRSNEYVAKKFVKGNKEVAGRYIVGQVMNCLERKAPPHPSVADFSDKYIAMPDKPAVKGKNNFTP